MRGDARPQTHRPDFKEIVAYPAVRLAVWVLHGSLESQSVDIFRPDYGERLDAARGTTRPGWLEVPQGASGGE